MSRLHVVVGGGSSGIALVRKLLEDDDVILVERGELDQEQGSGPRPTLFERIMNIYPSIYIWCHRAFVDSTTQRSYTEPQRFLDGRQLCYAQGYGKGGSGGINAMIYTLGNKLVYDKMWPKEWNYERIHSTLCNLLQHYTPSIVSTSGNVSSILRGSHKIDTCDDNTATVVDNKSVVTSYYTTIHSSGTDRINQASALLSPSQNRAHKGRLTILSHCSVLKIHFEGNTATSLLVSRKIITPSGDRVEREVIKPERGGEIVLCAGAFESPRILLASGLGDRPSLETNAKADTNMTGNTCDGGAARFEETSSSPASLTSLPTLVDIGQYLQDHCVLPYMLLGNWHSHWRTFHAQNIPYYGNRPAYPLNGIHGWVNLNADGSVWTEDASEPPR